MLIQKIAKVHGLSRQAIIRKIDSHLVGFSINERLLKRYENGEATPERKEAIDLAISKAFPNHSLSEIKKPSDTRFRIPWRGIFMTVIGIFCVVTIGLYAAYRDQPVWKEYEEFLGVIATLVSIAGFFIGLDWLKRNKG